MATRFNWATYGAGVIGHQLAKALELAENNHVILAEAMTIYHMPIYKKLRYPEEDTRF